MYPIEVKRPSKNGYFYPSEAINYYGGYGRDSITIHWWGGGEPASAHDNIVNYFLGQAIAGVKSVNYVVSDIRITEMVPATDVAWTNTGASNAYNITIEHQPTLGDEGYKKSGWLVWQLRVRFGKYLPLYPHSKFYSTACPGTISLDRIEQEAQKWARGDYNPAPQKPEWEANLKPVPPTKMYTNDGAGLVDLTNGTVKQRFGLDTPIDIAAETTYLGTKYLLSAYSYSKHLPNGIPAGALKLKPTPPPEPTPTPQPEWVTNLLDIDDTKYYLIKDSNLQDITTGRDVQPVKSFKKGDEFVASAKTKARGRDYVITDYSFKKAIFNGLPVDELSLLPPTPDTPPVPPTPVPTPDERLNVLEALVKKIVDFLSRMFGFKP